MADAVIADGEGGFGDAQAAPLQHLLGPPETLIPDALENGHAIDLADSGPIRLKAGYAYLKTDDLTRAAGFFQAALDRSGNDASLDN